MKTTQVLPGDNAVMLKGRPEAVPSSVLVRLAENPSTNTLQTCRDVKLVIGTRFYRIEPLSLLGRRAVAGQSRFVSEGTLAVHALDAAVGAEDSHFNVCGQVWPLTPGVREAFRFFLGEFRQRGGTPAVPVAQPMPAPTEPPSTAPAAPAAPAAPPAPGTPAVAPAAPAPSGSAAPAAPPPPAPAKPAAPPRAR